MSRITRLFEFLDLTGKDGRPSFAKLVTVVVLVWAIVAGMMNEYIATLVVVAAFGRPVLLAFLQRFSFSWSKVRTEAVEHRHDPGA